MTTKEMEIQKRIDHWEQQITDTEKNLGFFKNFLETEKEYLQIEKDRQKRTTIRSEIRQAGKDYIDSIKDRELAYIACELQDKNEQWVLDHPDTLGSEIILKQGLSENQKNWLDRLQKKLKGEKLDE